MSGSQEIPLRAKPMQGEIAEVGTNTGERRALLLARLGSKPQQKKLFKSMKRVISQATPSQELD